MEILDEVRKPLSIQSIALALLPSSLLDTSEKLTLKTSKNALF